MKILSASFFYKNNEAGGLGITFKPPDFTPDELTSMFQGADVKRYFRDTDASLGTNVVATYFSQLDSIAAASKHGPMPMQMALMAALNIIYLTERGFLANDEFNGVQFVHGR